MAKSFTSYSKHRKAIMQQVYRLEKKGFTVPERYHLPTVRELRAMPKSEAVRAEKRAKSYTTKAVRTTAFKKSKTVSVKTGKPKEVRVSYTTAVKQTRRASAKRAAETRKEKKDIDLQLEKWAMDFLDQVPEDLHWEGENYIDQVRKGYTGSFGEYLSGAGEQPDSMDVFLGKIETLDESDAETAKALRDLYQHEKTAVGESGMIERFLKFEGKLPEFDYHYENGHLDTTEVLRMAQIITGKPLSGAQAKRLKDAIDKDTGA